MMRKKLISFVHSYINDAEETYYSKTHTVLKMCRNKHTRKFIDAKTSVLDPRGIYVLKIADHATKPSQNNKNGPIRCHSKHYDHETGCIEDLELDSVHPLYVWKGEIAVDLSYLIIDDDGYMKTRCKNYLPQVLS